MTSAARTVLVAEDDQAIRDLIRATLARRGFSVLDAANGRQAMRLIEAGDIEIDVLVSDVSMPEIGGFELLALARTKRPGLALVMMSGSHRTELRSEAIRGDVTLLEKPFTLDDLTEAIDTALARGPG